MEQQQSSNKKKRIVVSVLIVSVLLVGGYLLMNKQEVQVTQEETSHTGLDYIIKKVRGINIGQGIGVGAQPTNLPGEILLTINPPREENSLQLNDTDHSHVQRRRASVNMSMRPIILGNVYGNDGTIRQPSPNLAFIAPPQLNEIRSIHYNTRTRSRSDWRMRLVPRSSPYSDIPINGSDVRFRLVIDSSEPLRERGNKLIGKNIKIDFSGATKEISFPRYANISQPQYTQAQIASNESLQRPANITSYIVKPQAWKVNFIDRGNNKYWAVFTLRRGYELQLSDVVYIDPTVVITDPSLYDDSHNITHETNYSHITLSDSNALVYLPFDRAITGSFEDHSESQYDGTYVNNADYTSSGKYAGGLLLTASNSDTAYLGSSGGIGLTKNGTIAAWVKPTSNEPSEWRVLSTKQQYDETNGFQLVIDENQGADLVLWAQGSTAASCEDVEWAQDTWHHIAATWTGSTATLYLDGTDCTTESSISEVKDSANNLYIGSENASQYYFDGVIDEVYITSTVLSSSQISDLHSTGLERMSTGAYVTYNNLNLSETGNETVFSTYINQTLPLNDGEDFTVQMGSDNGTGYDYSTEYHVSTILNYTEPISATTPNNISLKINFYPSNDEFISPLLEDSLNLISREYNLPEIQFENPTPPTGPHDNETIPVNVTSQDLDGDHMTFLNFDNDVLLYLSMDEINQTANIPLDQSNYNQSITKYGDAEISSSNGYYGNGTKFDGVTDYYNISTLTLNLNETQGFSMFAWAKSEVGSTDMAMLFAQENGDGIGYPMLFIHSTTGRIQTNQRVPGGVTLQYDPGTYHDSTWHHFGFVYNGTTRQLWVDGVMVIDDPEVSLQSANGNFIIGANKGGIQLSDFSIDEAIVINRSLTETEIKALHNSSGTQYYNEFGTYEQNTNHTFTATIRDTDGETASTDEFFIVISNETGGGELLAEVEWNGTVGYAGLGYGNNEKGCVDSNGDLHLVFADDGGDFVHSKSTDDGQSWTSVEVIDLSEADELNIACGTGGTIIISYVAESGGLHDAHYQISTNYGSSFGSQIQIDGEASIINDMAMAIDSQNEPHFCLSSSSDLWYVNSTTAGNSTNEISGADADLCDIEVDDNDAVFIAVKDTTAGDDWDIMSSLDNWATRNLAYNTGTNLGSGQDRTINLVITEHGVIHLVGSRSSKIWHCRGTVSNWNGGGGAYTCSQIYTSSAFASTAAYDKNWGLYVLAQNQGAYTTNTEVIMFNSTNNGTGWTTTFRHFNCCGVPTIFDSRHSESNEMEGMLRYAYQDIDDNNNVYFENITLYAVETGTTYYVYSGGNWAIDCSQNGFINTSYDVGGNNITGTGSGTITITANVSNVDEYRTDWPACTTNIVGGSIQ